jgi:uncharacterized protein YidB (DUF937 family)
MSIFETAVEAVKNQTVDNPNNSGVDSKMMAAILGLVNNPALGGNLSGLIEKFSQSGLGEQVASWVSTGKNLPVSGEQIQSALGSSFVQSFAEKLGIHSEEAASKLANSLPQVIDKLTPNGEVSGNGNLMELGMVALSSFLGNKST